MIEHDVEQGTDAWRKLRLGRPTCSRFHHIMQPARRKPSERAPLYLLELVDEWVHGLRDEPFENEWIRRGRILEPQARFDYEIQRGVQVRRTGFITRDDGLCGGSPDGLVGSDTVLELKVHSPQVHAKNRSPSHHVGQCQALLYITEREVAHLYRYSTTEESALQVIERDDSYIAALIPILDAFIEELEEAKAQVEHCRLPERRPANTLK